MGESWKISFDGTETMEALIPKAQSSIMQPYFQAMEQRSSAISSTLVSTQDFLTNIDMAGGSEATADIDAAVAESKDAIKVNAASILEARIFEGQDLTDLSKTDHFDQHLEAAMKIIPKVAEQYITDG